MKTWKQTHKKPQTPWTCLVGNNIESMYFRDLLKTMTSHSNIQLYFHCDPIADGEERTSAEANVHSSTTYTDEAQAGTELTPSKTCSGSEENNIPEPDQPCFLCMDSLRAHSMVTITRKLRK